MAFVEGATVHIKGASYTVVRAYNEIDYVADDGTHVGQHQTVELHDGSASLLLPTHALKIYADRPERVGLFKIVQEEPPEWIEHPKSRGGIVRYDHIKDIDLSEIEQV